MINKGNRRQERARVKIRSQKNRPRLSVFRSNRYLFAQIIDDKKGETVVGISEKVLLKPDEPKTNTARELGMTIAKMAKDLKIKDVVFDRGKYSYHGRVKEVAEGAREGGLNF